MNVNIQSLSTGLSGCTRSPFIVIATLLATLFIASCDSDLDTRNVNPIDDQVPNQETNQEPSQEPDQAPGQVPDDGVFTLQSSSESILINEGGAPVPVIINVQRSGDSNRQIQLSAQANSATDADNLSLSFPDPEIDAGESAGQLMVQLSIGSRPILQQERTLTVTGTDSLGSSSSTTITLDVQPTARPDIYLLVGQSNMVGSSENNARRDGSGEPDEISPRIMQLNVTGNDNRFNVAEAFTDPEQIYNNSQPLTPALDPLHDGFESSGSKAGTRIGLGLSFAKAALPNTSADIYLVPAAWSDTGFCKRNTAFVEGVGWNATEKNNPALSGTLLHDRAIARTNAAILETGGILRGILWHQGEADSDEPACAATYQDNLIELIGSLRTNIDADARGSQARAADASIPFIAGTMSMGEDLSQFSETKLMVDSVHRTLASFVQFADFVNADDLIPPAFSCGAGSCIHFGSEAYREMGKRYYDVLDSIITSP